MSGDIAGLVESSTNLGVVATTDSAILFENAIRSNIKSMKYNILNQMKTIANIFNIGIEIDSDYPEWEYQACLLYTSNNDIIIIVQHNIIDKNYGN